MNNLRQDLLFTSKRRAYYITTLALLSAVCYVGRITFAFIPNVQPITTIFILVAITFGPISSILLMTLTMFLTNIALGFGTWTLFQIMTYTVIIVLASCILSVRQHIPIIIFCIVSGYLYGFIYAIFDVILYHIVSFWGYYTAGIIFDTYHAIGNGAFAIVLLPILIPLLQKQKQRLLT